MNLFSRYRKEALILGIGAANMLAISIAQHATSSPSLLRALDDERWTLENLLIVVLTWFGWRGAPAEDRPIRFLFFLGWTAYAIGQVFWDIQVAIGWNPFPAPGDLFYLTLAPLLGAGFFCAARPGMAKGEAVGLGLDVASIGIMALTLTLALYLPEWKDLPVLTNLATILYPVFYLTALGMGVMAVLVRRLRLTGGVVLSILGLAGFAYCWLDWNYRTLRGDALDGTLLGYGFSVTSLIAGVGASRWRGIPSASHVYERWSLRIQRLVPPLLLLAACFAVVFGHYHFNRAVNIVVDIGAVVMIVLAATRQSQVLYEQDQLLKTEQRLERSEGQMRELVTASSDVIFSVAAGADGTFRYQAINPAGEAIGLKESVMRGRTSRQCFPAEPAAALNDCYRACARTGKPVSRDIALPVEGGTAWFEIVLVPLPDERGQVNRINGIARNISARKSVLEAAEAHGAALERRVEERTRELQAAYRDVEQASRAKSQFLANMSHELRTPLNGILGYAQILRKLPDATGRLHPGLAVIHQCGDHLLHLINDILDLAKIEADKMELNPTDFDLHRFLRGLCSMVRVSAMEKGLYFREHLDPALPQRVRADEKRLRQVVLNLLGNAVKFTDKGGVTLRVERAGDQVSFAVEDTGIGIPEDKVAQLFKPFGQVGDTQHNAQGSGLGLVLSQRLVALMGGAIELRSRPGEGSRFSFQATLPEVRDAPLAAAGGGPREIVGYHGPRITVLNVDDKDENRAVLEGMLSPLGFEVIGAEDGARALDQAVLRRPRVVLTDLVMPVMDGFELTRRLRADPLLGKVVIIVVSASIYDFHTEESRQAGSDDFISKPIDLPRLLECLGRHLSIEWVREGEEAAAGLSSGSAPAGEAALADAVPPFPAGYGERLAALAQKGAVRQLVDAARELAGKDPAFRGLAGRIEELAQDFQIDRIRQLLQSHPAS